MKYRAFWSPYAEIWLEQLFAAVAAPELFVTAAHEIDRILGKDPTEFGESRYDTARIGFIRPLGVQYESWKTLRL